MTAIDTGRALLQAILDEPDSDDRRIVYADYLEENGQGTRADFIRVQLRLAECERVPGRPTAVWELFGWLIARCQEQRAINAFIGDGRACDCERCLRKLEGELLHNWRNFIGSEIFQLIPEAARYDDHIIMRRGFVEEISCRCQDWLDHAGTIMARHPVTRVRLLDKEPGPIGTDDVLYCWRNVGIGATSVRTMDVETIDGVPLTTGFVLHQRAEDPADNGVYYVASNTLPGELFRLLPNCDKASEPEPGIVVVYDSKEKAHADLTDACLAYGKFAAAKLRQQREATTP